jgi:hypothetical protein
MPFPIVGVQGPSAAGKSTLASRLAKAWGAQIIHEMAEGPDWAGHTYPANPSTSEEVAANRLAFLEYECRRWARALHASRSTPVVFDTEWIGHLLWGLCDLPITYPNLDQTSITRATLSAYRDRAQDGALGACDRVLLLTPPEETIRHQRNADASRRRRNFERNLAVWRAQTTYWEHLGEVLGERLRLVSEASVQLDSMAPMTGGERRTIALEALDAIEVITTGGR